MLDEITPIVLTYNEAPNIERTLEGLRWAKDIVLVDSLSTDETLTIARRFANVRVFERRFDGHREQWQYALDETGIETPWVLTVDADWVMTDALHAELATLAAPESIAGYWIPFQFCIYGEPLAASQYPPVCALFRRALGVFVQEDHTQRIAVTGSLGKLSSSFVHDDRKSLTRWLWAQGRYAQLEAEMLVTKRFRDLRWSGRLRRGCIIMPWLAPLHVLLVKGGLLAGRAGLVYALQRMVAESLIALHILARRWPQAKSGGEPDR